NFIIGRITQQNQSGLHPIELVMWLIFRMFLIQSGKSLAGGEPQGLKFETPCDRELVGSTDYHAFLLRYEKFNKISRPREFPFHRFPQLSMLFPPVASS